MTTLSELTLDGRLSLGAGASSKALFDFYGDDLKTWFHAQRATHDAIMVGAGTVRADDPELTVRHADGPNPLRVVASSRGDLPPASRLLHDGVPTLIALSERATTATRARLEARPHVETVVCGATTVDLHGLMDILDRRGVASLIVEGGSRLLHAFHAAGLVSRIVIKHIPVIAGAPDAPGYLTPADGTSRLPLSRWRLEDWFVRSGVAISVHVPLEAGA